MSFLCHKIGRAEYLTAPNLTTAHCFTTRHGGVSQGPLRSMNLGAHRGDSLENIRENYRRICAFLGSDPKRLVLTRQNHGDTVRVVTQDDMIGSPDHHDYPFCDALITDVAGVSLARQVQHSKIY